uniref:Uncharacterized protein n=1 Tax=Rhodnius prolixus TaxID=13249 RepID=T1I5P9_RHOPR
MAEEVAEEGPARAVKSPEECEVAQKAVTGASGRNLPKAMENLSKAYQHSKTCKKCNETLGEFLGDIIQQLGVKLPRVKVNIVHCNISPLSTHLYWINHSLTYLPLFFLFFRISVIEMLNVCSYFHLS